MEFALDKSKAIVNKAMEHGAWGWDDPNAVTDQSYLETAVKLVEASLKASENKSINDAVLEILHVAGVEPASDVSKEAYARRFGQAQPAPASAEAAPTGAFAQVTPEDASAMAKAAAAPVEPQRVADPATPNGIPAEVNIEDIFPGYDDLKVADIKAAVLGSAASGDLSPEEWARILAYEEAHEERKTILKLQPEFKAPEPVAQPTAPSATGTFAQTNGDAGDSIGAFYNGETISRAQQEGLPIPPNVNTEVSPTLPIDITTTSDQDLSRLATIFHSLFARAQWLISQEEGRERAAEQLEHDAHRDAYSHAYEMHKGAIPEGKAGPTALDAARKLAEKDADDAEHVSKWRSRKIRHAIDARELKALSAGYDKAVWRINEELERRSRLQTTAHASR